MSSGFTVIQDRPRFAKREVALYTHKVPEKRSAVEFFYKLIVGEELAKELGIGRNVGTLVAWGQGTDQGKLQLTRAASTGPSWPVRETNRGHVAIAISSTPDWVRRDIEIYERALAYEQDTSKRVLIVRLPIKVISNA